MRLDLFGKEGLKMILYMREALQNDEATPTKHIRHM